MSLQGSLDTFALPDVLVLLAGTGKTGELQVTGSRSAEPGGDELTARVWFEDGRLAGHDDAGSPTITEAVLSLLRLRRGAFDFTPGPVPDSRDAYEVVPVLDEARARLAEWTDIEAVVPSADAWLTLAVPAPADPITISAEQWRLIVAIGSGRSVGGVVADLGAGELGGFRAVKEIVVAGLVAVEAGREMTPAASAQLEWATPISSWGDGALAAAPAAWSAPPGDEAYGALRVVPDVDSVPAWRAEMADIHDLDSLVPSPRADPEAVIAAPATEDGEAVAADDEDEPLNRGLLLKFLSSVRT